MKIKTYFLRCKSVTRPNAIIKFLKQIGGPTHRCLYKGVIQPKILCVEIWNFILQINVYTAYFIKFVNENIALLNFRIHKNDSYSVSNEIVHEIEY